MARGTRAHRLGRRQSYGHSPVAEPSICRTAARRIALAVATPRPQDWCCIGPLWPGRGCCRRLGRCCRGTATRSGPPTPADGPEAVGGGPPPGGELVIPVFAAGFSFRTTGVDGLVLIGPVGPGALADGVVDAGGAGAVVSIGGLGRDVTGAPRPVVDGVARAGPDRFRASRQRTRCCWHRSRRWRRRRRGRGYADRGRARRDRLRRHCRRHRWRAWGCRCARKGRTCRRHASRRYASCRYASCRYASCRFASCGFTGRPSPSRHGRDRRWRSGRRVRGTRRPRLARGRDRALSPGLYCRCRQNCRRRVPMAGRPRTFPDFAAVDAAAHSRTRSLRVVTVPWPPEPAVNEQQTPTVPPGLVVGGNARGPAVPWPPSGEVTPGPAGAVR